jgi:putative inorganic carbon (hco3(-)) transporter
MPLRTLLFLLGFAGTAGGALFVPLLGVLGYIALYNLGAERQWWFAPISGLDLRCSLTLAVATAIGMTLHWRNLQFGKQILHSQEKLLLLFLGLIWFSTFIGEPTEGAYTIVDHPSVKMTKVVIFALMLTHVVTTVKSLDLLMWVMTAGALVLGLQAYWTPYSAFTHGRLETVGGPDFSESNFLAAYLAAMLPIIGMQFLRSGWIGKLACLLAGVFATNALVLTRSRGALLGIGTGALVAFLLAPKQYRVAIAVGIVVAIAGGLYLTDPAYYQRAGTISFSDEQRDLSAQSRLDAWEASVQMLKDHPWGIGAGNFFQAIGRYNRDRAGMDAHNGFVRCYTELGIQGLLIFIALIGNALWTLRRAIKETRQLPEEEQKTAMWLSYGLAISLVVVLTDTMTVTLLYVEALWWLLMLPVCLDRAVENLKANLAPIPSIKPSKPTRKTARAVPVLEGK